MRGFWTVARTEFTLLRRGRGLWLAGALMAVVGVWQASALREFPPGAWGQFTFLALLVGLLLTFTTGDQIRRDRERRVADVLLSAPVATGAYVAGKYLAALAGLLGLASVGLLAAVITDRVYEWRDPPFMLGYSSFPPLGAWPYLVGWGLLIVTPLAFGAALALACLTLVRGGRTVAAFVVIAIFLLPAFAGDWPPLLDLVGLGGRTQRSIAVSAAPGRLAADQLQNIPYDPRNPGYFSYNRLPADVKAEVVRLVRADLPPRLPAVFWWNRALFLGLAGALVGLTASGVGRGRRGRG